MIYHCRKRPKRTADAKGPEQAREVIGCVACRLMRERLCEGAKGERE